MYTVTAANLPALADGVGGREGRGWEGEKASCNISKTRSDKSYDLPNLQLIEDPRAHSISSRIVTACVTQT